MTVDIILSALGGSAVVFNVLEVVSSNPGTVSMSPVGRIEPCWSEWQARTRPLSLHHGTHDIRSRLRSESLVQPFVK